MNPIDNPNSGGSKLAIASSWQRCRNDYKLSQYAPRPIMRLQDREIERRREEFIASLEGETQEIERLADLTRHAHQGLVVADTDCTLLMNFQEQSAINYLEPAGIKAGYCWPEARAATNAVSVTLQEQKTITIAGKNHYYKSHQQFSCTGTPLFDQNNELIGALAIAGIDDKNPHHYVFYQYILSLAAARIQARLFKSHFSGIDTMHLSLASPGNSADESINALCAINASGEIIGLTRHAAELLGYRHHEELLNQQADAIFGQDVDRLAALAGTRIKLDNSQDSAVIATPYLNSTTIRQSAGRLNRPAKQPLNHLTGHDKHMLSVTDRARELYGHGVPLLLQGETGCGKQTFARALHREAAFSDAPFMSIDCAIADVSGGSIDKFLAELDSLRSLHRTAQQDFAGTVYLKAIDKLSESLQMQLAALLGEIDATMQSSSLRAVNKLRVIASIQDEPAKLLQQRKLYPELLHNINGACITLNPLRERSDVKWLLTQISSELAQESVDISAAAEKRLLAYHWPGNFRELRHTLRYCLLCGNGKNIYEVDLPDTIRNYIDQSVTVEKTTELSPGTSSDNLPDENNPRHLRSALESANWNVSKAARRLGISRATIYRKMQEFQLSRPE